MKPITEKLWRGKNLATWGWALVAMLALILTAIKHTFHVFF